jgi:hypothetical protein
MRDMRRSNTFLLCSLLALASFAVVGCGSDNSVAPAVDTVPPAIPGGIAAWNASGGTVGLSWDANVSDPDLAGYLIFHASSPDGSFSLLSTQPVTSNGFTDDSATAGMTHYYRVAALAVNDNQSALSSTIAIAVAAASGRSFERASN